jgi:hypothetical protein
LAELGRFAVTWRGYQHNGPIPHVRGRIVPQGWIAGVVPGALMVVVLGLERFERYVLGTAMRRRRPVDRYDHR